MVVDVKFIFDTELINELQKLIVNANKSLLLVSPFIDIDSRVKVALQSKLNDLDFELLVLFGKNENNIYKSIKKDSLEFLKTFPNVDIRYNPLLHAKYYQNDYDFILTSLNLYDYSLANNIEAGILCRHTSKGLIGKALSHASEFVVQIEDKVKEGFLGHDLEIMPMDKFQDIFDNSTKMYKTKANTSSKGGLAGMFGSKKLDGYVVEYDNFPKGANFSVTMDSIALFPENQPITKTLSISQLSKHFGVESEVILNLIVKNELVKENIITPQGEKAGLVIKKYMGREYIAYPDNLKVFDELR
jgi:hypothetical protein